MPTQHPTTSALALASLLFHLKRRNGAERRASDAKSGWLRDFGTEWRDCLRASAWARARFDLVIEGFVLNLHVRYPEFDDGAAVGYGLGAAILEQSNGPGAGDGERPNPVLISRTESHHSDPSPTEFLALKLRLGKPLWCARGLRRVFFDISDMSRANETGYFPIPQRSRCSTAFANPSP